MFFDPYWKYQAGYEAGSCIVVAIYEHKPVFYCTWSIFLSYYDKCLKDVTDAELALQGKATITEDATFLITAGGGEYKEKTGTLFSKIKDGEFFKYDLEFY